MTLLIIIMAMTNMAIGFGLAVYLGHGQSPVQIKLGRFRAPKIEDTPSIDDEEVSTPSSEPAQNRPESRAAAEPPTVETPASKTSDQKSEEPATDESDKPSLGPQLDVSDLMPGAEAVVPPEETAPEAQPEAAAEADAVEESAALVAEAKAEPAEVVEELLLNEPPETPGEASSEPTTAASEPVATVDTETTVAATESSSELPNAPSTTDDVGTLEADSESLDTDESEADENLSDKQIDQTAEESAEAELPTEETAASEETLLEESDDKEVVVEEVAEEVDELESLSQLLQTAVADGDAGEADNSEEFGAPEESGVVEADDVTELLVDAEPEVVEELLLDEPVEELLMEEDDPTTAENTTTQKAEPVTAPAAADEMVSGLAAFQEQLQEQAEQHKEAATETAVKDSEPDVVLEEATSNTSTEGTVSAEAAQEGIEAFQAQLTSQQSEMETAQPSGEQKTAEGSEVEPEVLAGIQSFREQLSQMQKSPPQLPSDAPEELLEAAAAD